MLKIRPLSFTNGISKGFSSPVKEIPLSKVKKGDVVQITRLDGDFAQKPEFRSFFISMSGVLPVSDKFVPKNVDVVQKSGSGLVLRNGTTTVALGARHCKEIFCRKIDNVSSAEHFSKMNKKAKSGLDLIKKLLIFF